jgi:hypothetical protein
MPQQTVTSMLGTVYQGERPPRVCVCVCDGGEVDMFAGQLRVV